MPEIVPLTSGREETNLRVTLTAGPKLEFYQEGLQGDEWSQVEKFLPQALVWCIERGTLPRVYWEGARNLIAVALNEVGLVDIAHFLLLEQLEQQVQVALHRNQQEGLAYWKFWGGIDWLNQMMTRVEVFGSGKMGDVFKPKKFFGEAAARQLRKLRDDVVTAAHHMITTIEALSKTERSLNPTERVVVELLKLIEQELRAVSDFERKVEQIKAEKKQAAQVEKAARKAQKKT